jgi:hypothetical protein
MIEIEVSDSERRTLMNYKCRALHIMGQAKSEAVLLTTA